MKIDHIAIWTYNLEGLRKFYMHYFNAISNNMYHNKSKNFRSWFLSFDNGCRIELMEKPNIPVTKNDPESEFTGLIHFAINVEGKDNVNSLTEKLRLDGHKIIGEPRTTGDGCYESVILDPDGNRIEIIA